MYNEDTIKVMNINKESLLKDISAYSNYRGGTIVFSVEGDVTKKYLELLSFIDSNISPIPDYRITINNDNTIEFIVNEGLYKPYLYRNRAYKRNDSSSVEVDRVEFNRLVLEGMNQTFEEQISSKQDLNFDVLEKTLIRELKIEN